MNTHVNGNPQIQYIASCIGIIFFGVAFLALGAIMPVITQEYGLDDKMSALLAAILPAGTLIGSLVFGPVIDRYGYKSLMITSNLIGAAGLFMIATSASFPVLIIGIAGLGISGGLINGFTNALASDVSTDSNRDRNMLFLGLFYCLGAIATTYSIPLLSDTVSYKMILMGAGVLMAAVCIFYMVIRLPKAKYAGGIPAKKVLDLLKQPLLLVFSFVLFFQGAIEGITNNRISQYLINVENFSIKQAGVALSFVLIGLAIGRLCAGIFIKRLTKQVIIVSGMVIAGIGVIILSACTALEPIIHLPFTTITIIGTTLIGFGITATVPIVLGVLGGIYKEMSGIAFSIAITICLIGNSLLNYLMGFLGITAFPYMIGCCMIMIIVLFSIGYKMMQANKQSSQI